MGLKSQTFQVRNPVEDRPIWAPRPYLRPSQVDLRRSQSQASQSANARPTFRTEPFTFAKNTRGEKLHHFSYFGSHIDLFSSGTLLPGSRHL